MTGLLILAVLVSAPGLEKDSAPDYRTKVAPLLKKYCGGCHNNDFPEGKFSLETYADLQKGTKHGPALLPGDPEGSLMVRAITGKSEPMMPPEDEPRPSAEEIAVLESWIASGAKGPEGEEPDRLTLVVPKVTAHSEVRPVAAMDVSRDGRWTAVARESEVTLFAGSGEEVTGGEAAGRSFGSFPGQVTALHFTPDGKRLVAASGLAGLGGLASVWNVADGSLVRSFEGHRDLLYDAELSPDGKILATCGYDKNIEIRDFESGKLLRTLEGHTGAVFDIAFSPDGRFLVSASADDTCKVWRVEDGLRMDTLPQPLKEEYTCRFSPDGSRIVAAGADNNIRVWRFVSREKPAINPMEAARFAHEGAIVRLDFSPDGSRIVSLAEDRSVKVWRASDLKEIQLWEDQPDVPTALAFSSDGSTFDVGRMDGSLQTYPTPDLPPEETPGPETRPERVVKVADAPVMEVSETEPDNSPEQAREIRLPVKVKGVVNGGEKGHEDADLYRFSAKAGECWVFEVDAARSGSKLDSFIEVLDANGERVPRVLLQAVRDSYFTFRGKNGDQSNDFRLFNWQEMSINDYLYANGEVARLWLYPRGPDSGFGVYPGEGNRWGYFDTTPLAHALNETCYVVRPHAPGSALLENGLPVFTIYYENDDDAHRELGKDSRLYFTAPSDGEYLLKVRDVRGLQGPDFGYVLAGRPRRPDFQVTLSGADPKVAAGSAREFSVSAKRTDGFEGPIRIEIEGVPPGFHVTSPLVIEPGQLQASGVVYADDDARAPSDGSAKMTVSASAKVEGREVVHEVNPLGSVALAPKPKLRVKVAPAEGGAEPVSGPDDDLLEFVIEAGQTIMLKVQVDRIDFKERVLLGREGSKRNLPFGTIIDNLGLNGLMVPEGKTERTFFITADPVTAEQTRLFHLTTSASGGVSSFPVRLRVVRPRPEVAKAARSASDEQD